MIHSMGMVCSLGIVFRDTVPGDFLMRSLKIVFPEMLLRNSISFLIHSFGIVIFYTLPVDNIS